MKTVSNKVSPEKIAEIEKFDGKIVDSIDDLAGIFMGFNDFYGTNSKSEARELVKALEYMLDGFAKDVCKTVNTYGRMSDKQQYCIKRGIVECGGFYVQFGNLRPINGWKHLG